MFNLNLVKNLLQQKINEVILESSALKVAQGTAAMVKTEDLVNYIK